MYKGKNRFVIYWSTVAIDLLLAMTDKEWKFSQLRVALNVG